MKKTTLLFVFFSLLFNLSVAAQKTIWLDASRNETTKENAVYYRPAPKKMDNGYWLVDYYRSGKKRKEGFSTRKETAEEMYIGVVKYYYENGVKFQEMRYSEGKLDGNFYEFYKTGNLNTVGKYTNGLRDGIWKVFYENGKIKEKGKYTIGEKVGVWKTFYKNI